MKLFICILLCINVLAKPINKTIDELLQERESAKVKISNYDPFERAKPLLKKKSKKIIFKRKLNLELIAVLNNKAFISGKWYKKGDFALGEKLTKITPTAVYLKKGNKTKILTLSTKNKSMFKITQKELK